MRPAGLRLVRVGGGRGRAVAYGGSRGEYTPTAYLVTLGVAAPAAGVQQAAPGGSAVRGGGQGRRRTRSLRGAVVRHLHLHEFAVLQKTTADGTLRTTASFDSTLRFYAEKKSHARVRGAMLRDVCAFMRNDVEQGIRFGP